MTLEDPCKKCPLFSGKELTDPKPTPCQDKNGLFLGIISIFACQAYLEHLLKNGRQGD